MSTESIKDLDQKEDDEEIPPGVKIDKSDKPNLDPSEQVLPDAEELPIKELTTDSGKWKKILTKFDEIYGTHTSIGDIQFEDFQHPPATPDPILNVLSVFDCENLLSTAISYLESFAVDFAVYREQKQKKFDTEIEIKEFVELSKVHRDEVRAGFYQLPYKKALRFKRAEEFVNLGSTANYTRYDWLRKNYVKEEQIDAYATSLHYSPQIGNYPFTVEEWKKPTKTYSYTYDGKKFRGWKTSIAGALAGYKNHDHSIAEVFDAGTYQAWHSFKSAKSASFEKSLGFGIEADWSKKDATFRLRRTNVSKNIMELKTHEASRVSGALNYQELAEISSNKVVFKQLLGEQLLETAREGLKIVYGIESWIPNRSSPSYFHDLLLSALELQSKLDNFYRKDQSFALPISVKNLIGDTRFARGKVSGVWRIDLAESKFSGQFHVRLRGLSVHVNSSGRGFWAVRAKPPLTSFARHLGNTGEEIALDQTKLPPVIVGRSGNRGQIREPDLVGISALHNVSPFGVWEISVQNTSHLGESKDLIEDIEIDFHIAMRFAS